MVTSSAQYGPFKPSNDTGLVGGAIGGTIVTSTRATSPTFSKTNPPFSTSVAGKVPKTVDSASRGDDGKIVRGFIRRENDTDKADPTSGYRLNFMYNPETIQRQFIAYLDQGALDPFNSINGSGNLAAPPGILDFSFELMFDRQLEVFRDDNHPGTKVDYDYFDLVVRGVVPGVSAIPDNGVMMVNPRNITVVFGPDLTVTGKPYNASVSFDKFSHKMTPTRIRVLMQMKVLTVGPRPLAYTYQTATAQAEFAATVPYDNTITASITNTVDATAANATGSAFIDALRLDWSGGTSSSTGGVPLQGSDAGAAQPGSAGAPTGNIVDVGGIKVDQSIAANLKSMMEAAAKDNIKLAGGGWRSNAQQIKLRGDHGCRGREMDPNCKCSPPTAVPGKSNHEKGLAIDFSPCGKGSPVFNWLKAHAATYHFYNLPSESWHWSVDGR
jgi:hypothetical protein